MTADQPARTGVLAGTPPSPALRIGPAAPAVRLLAFHHAGGSAAAYLPFVSALPPDTELVLFQLPGRGPRERHLRPRDFDHALTGFRAQAEGLFDRPAVVLGHSLGALFAYALVAGLDGPRRRAVGALVLSAAPAALDRAAGRPVPVPAPRDPERLEWELRAYGGCPPEVLADAGRLAEAVCLYGDDLLLTDTYPGAPAPADVPVERWTGRADPAFQGRPADRGAAGSGPSDRCRSYPGGHFFLFERDEPAADLADVLRRARRAPPPRRETGGAST